MNWGRWSKSLITINFLLLMIIAGLHINQNETEDTEAAGKPVIQTEAKTEAKIEKPKIALTFDDGPHPEYTARLLDGLQERDVKATFFIIGKNIKGNEALIKRMQEEGHVLGNHTYDHVQITALSDAQACEQVIKANKAIEEITGEYPDLLRPPFGSWKEGLDCGKEMFIAGWNIDPKDWTTTNIDEIVTKVCKNAQEDGIILLHDWYDTSVSAALIIVDLLQAEGYEFVTMDELLTE